jgi:hypothetical protein
MGYSRTVGRAAQRAARIGVARRMVRRAGDSGPYLPVAYPSGLAVSWFGARNDLWLC